MATPTVPHDPLFVETPAEAEDDTSPTALETEVEVAAPSTAYSQREFHYATHVMRDPAPHLSIEEIRKALIPFFPDLVQATHTERVVNEVLIVTFAKQVTRKGADPVSAPEAALSALATAIRTLPRFRDPISGIGLTPIMTLADLHAQRTDIRDLLDAYQNLPETIKRMGTQCHTLSPIPLPCIPHGF